MVDELDPRLEARLRWVLRDEADAIPFAVGVADLQRVRSERARARRAQRWSIAATAVAVIVVGGAVVAAGFGRLGPATAPASPSDSFSALPSFQRLDNVRTGGGPVLMQLEDVAGPQVHQWQFGLPRGAYAFQYVLACSGPGPMVVSLAADSVPAIQLHTGTCDGGVWTPEWDGTDDQAILSAASVSLVVDAQPGTAWRMIVADDGSGRIVQQFAGSPLLFRMPSFDWLVQRRPPGAIELARGSGLNTATGPSDEAESILRGIGSARAIEVSLFSVGGCPKLSVAAAGGPATALEYYPYGCLNKYTWQRTDATRTVSEVRLDVPAGTAWEAIVWDVSSVPSSLPPSPGTTTP